MAEVIDVRTGKVIPQKPGPKFQHGDRVATATGETGTVVSCSWQRCTVRMDRQQFATVAGERLPLLPVLTFLNGEVRAI